MPYRRWKPRIERGYEHGLDAVLNNLGYPGERNDVAIYLDVRGWNVTGTQLEQLFAHNRLPIPPTKEKPASTVFASTLLHRGTTPRSRYLTRNRLHQIKLGGVRRC